MKTLSVLFLTLALTSAAQAQDLARYTVRAKCYTVLLNSETFVAYDFGTQKGKSNYDCDNALENLEAVCRSLAKAHGLPHGTPYKDILITGKARSSESSISLSSSSQTGLYGLGLLGINHSRSNGHSRSEGSSASTQISYIPVTESDCKTNTKVPQDETPSIQSANFGS